MRRVRHRLLTSALCDPDYVSPAAQREEAKSATKLAKLIAKFEKFRAEYPVFSQPLAPLFDGLEHRVYWRPEGPQKFATILSDMSKKLAALDRYERRALSRRNLAIRIFDDLRRHLDGCCFDESA